MDVTPILDGLNKAQREAVTADNQALLVLAGAGSGKTRVLVHRIAWLIATENISPHAIMAVTFTNKASHEMKNRVESLLGRSASSMWIGTFHGLAHRLLRAHARDAELPDTFQILDSDDQLRVIKRVMREMNLDDNEWPPKQAQWFINKQKDEGKRPKDIQHNGDLFISTHTKVYHAYQQACATGGLVDFAELLLKAFELLRDNQHLREHYQERFLHLLVDEFQDTNGIQYAWLRLISASNCGITIVGDDDQSIYGWRGAKIENIQRFDREFSDAKTIRLEQNYRSTGTILKAANAVIANNQERMGKNLWTDDSEGEPISLYAAFNEQEEARFMAARIADWHQQGNAYSECAILYRSNAQSRVIEEFLLQRQIPYRIYGGLKFFERAEVKDTLAYLRLMYNNQDDAAFERVVNTPPRGLGQKSVEKVREMARIDQSTLWEAAQKIVAESALTPKATAALSGFIELVKLGYEEFHPLPLSEQIQLTIESTNLMEMYAKEKGEKALARKENLAELASAAREFDVEDYPDLSPMTAFLAHASLEAGDTQAEQYEDCVQMMTLHSAKGLEFPLVFIAGMEEKLFPHMMSMEEADKLEEERRLAYVGITRAMKKLYLLYAEKRRLWGKETYPAVSRFIREIPAQLKEEVRLNSQLSQPVFAGESESAQGANGFNLGQFVEHPKFGVGVILNYEGEGAQARVQVNFDSVGAKWLVLAYAKLEAC
ncbi:DNA helicase II [Aliikangiella coralliicola]|uniref:DNA 3'-5' helicase n=1 Tax=Aliikangiella coralliicola TaxID=2592383 RepID=A0A545UG20_9GAMM|nr:DNA helicase II [Aliikangiella coralliicola]TQV88421.1 DNA helicase II [Aliikangiella coralliicola]